MVTPAEAPDALVEKAAQAAHAKIVNDWAVQPPWEEISEGLRDRTRAVMRHALAAVLPEYRKRVIEEVATAVEQPDSRQFPSPGRGWDFQYAAALRRYAEPLTAEPKTAEEKIAFRKDGDRRVEEGKTS